MAESPAKELATADSALALPRIPDHTLLRRIGRGAYGEVWLARNVLGAYRAVKIVRRDGFETTRPFEREFAGIQKFEPISRFHRGLVQVLHVGRNEQEGYFFYVMELADNEQTGEEIEPNHYEPRTLQREIQTRGRLSIEESVRLGLGLADALAYLHQQSLIHRDIKPSNIIFVKGSPKLADIGLVCGSDAPPSFVGTEGYIPPEGPGTAQADIYSLGKVLYEMATGKSREQFPDLPTDLRANVERTALLEFNEIVLKAGAPDLRQRYRSALDLRTDLELLQAGGSVRAARRPQLLARSKVAEFVTAAISLGSRMVAVARDESIGRISGSALQARRRARAQRCLQEARILAKRSSSHLEGRQNNPRVIDLLEKAVSLEPALAEAHAELALAYTIRLFLYAPQEKQNEENAWLCLERAFSLNPNLPAAYLARARLKWTPLQHFPHAQAIDDFHEALALDPDLDEARHYLGLVLIHVGLIEEGMREFTQAIALNPGNNGAHYRIGETHLYAGECQKALDRFETIAPDFNPDLRAAHIGLALIGLGRSDEALERLRDFLAAHPTDAGGLVTSVEAIVYAALQREREAEYAIRRSSTKRGFGHFHHTEYHIACAYALMKRNDSAMEWLRKSVAEGFNCYPLFERDSNLAHLKTDPRFLEFLASEKERYESFKSKYAVHSSGAKRAA